MNKGDFPCQCCLWLLQAATVLSGALDHSMWFVCLTALSDGSQREWQLRVHYTLRSSRGRYHTVVDVSGPLVTHTGVDMRPCGGFVFHLFSKNLGS